MINNKKYFRLKKEYDADLNKRNAVIGVKDIRAPLGDATL
tara:strand:+ start:2075 stop:2194 length:120 start_codon:yes stop_codon:yes gene_type:complete